MSDDASQSNSDDHGFTLIEILIVMSILGLIIGSLSAAFVVIVRTSPTTEIRIDDARSTRGLATWLSHDTTSAPPYDTYDDKGWVDTSAGADACSGPVGSSNIVQFSWREEGFSTTTFFANYRYVTNGAEATVIRFACSSASTTSSVSLTSGLDPTDDPEVILIKPGTEVESVDFILHAAGGGDVLVQTGSRNPVEFYP